MWRHNRPKHPVLTIRRNIFTVLVIALVAMPVAMLVACTTPAAVEDSTFQPQKSQPSWPIAQFAGADAAQVVRYHQRDRVPLESLDSSYSKAIALAAFKDVSDDAGIQHAGIIVPHHLVPLAEIATTYDAVKPYNPDLIILLSPNHQKRPQALVTIGEAGILLKGAGSDLSVAPFDSGFAKTYPEYRPDDAAMAKEHGIYHQLPFVLAQGWKAQTLSIALARNLTHGDIERLRRKLVDYSATMGHKRILWIASIDFSHYLPAIDAQRMDFMTQTWIATKNHDAIAKSDDSSLDAPAVLNLMLRQFGDLLFIWNGNSATKLGYGFAEPGTSYMIYLTPPN